VATQENRDQEPEPKVMSPFGTIEGQSTAPQENRPALDDAVSISPFVRMVPGEDSIDPADQSRVIFEDFRPRVLDADTPEEVLEDDIPTVPKGLSAAEPAPSSESPSPTAPEKSEGTVPLVPPLSPTGLGPLPFEKSDAAQDDGSLSPSTAG